MLAEAHRWGDEWGAAMMLNLQASIRLWSGDVDKARVLGEKALAGFRRIDDRFGIIQALGTLNRAFVASGRTADAERSVEEIMVLADAFGEMAYPVMAAAGTAMHLGKGRRAAELGAEAVRHLDTTGANVDEARVVAAFGELLDGVARAGAHACCSTSTSTPRRSGSRRGRRRTRCSATTRRRSPTCTPSRRWPRSPSPT